jgi:hypothetical protein
VVSEERRFPGQGLIEENLSGRIGEMVFPSDDMSDMHQMVIDDTSEIVGGHPIGTDDNKIANSSRIEIHLSMDEVFKQDGSSSYTKSEDGLEAGRFHFGNFFCREGTAPPVIAGHLSPGELFFSKLLQSFFGAKTLITFSFLG